jgi:hypothetical protein
VGGLLGKRALEAGALQRSIGVAGERGRARRLAGTGERERQMFDGDRN